MRTYNGLTIDTIVLTACCGAHPVGPDGRERRTPKQLVEGETLTCPGCGEQTPKIEQEEVAWD